jgi:hypothetical protein
LRKRRAERAHANTNGIPVVQECVKQAELCEESVHGLFSGDGKRGQQDREALGACHFLDFC